MLFIRFCGGGGVKWLFRRSSDISHGTDVDVYDMVMFIYERSVKKGKYTGKKNIYIYIIRTIKTKGNYNTFSVFVCIYVSVC